MLNVIYAECRKEVLYAECHYAECCYADCRGATSCSTIDICSLDFMGLKLCAHRHVVHSKLVSFVNNKKDN
jgi:hypothetical protein